MVEMGDWASSDFLFIVAKNCKPYAEISPPREDRNSEKIYFHSSNSHDSTSFWSKGFSKRQRN